MAEVALVESDGFGRWLDGVLDSRDIKTRELAEAAGLHESEISRIRNARKQADFKQTFQIGMGVGRLVEMQRSKK